MNASSGASLVAVTRLALAEREGVMFFQEISKKIPRKWLDSHKKSPPNPR
jgi:hypothetical protein